jgi:tRNA threonylcarbamoyladenosine biosynthesis protein TsaB
MKLLAIETATRLVGCALWDEGGPLAASLLVAGQRHVEVLVPAIDALCRQAGISVADLDGVAVDVGPGLFTGLRVGLATATTIATARNIPAVGVTSLEALAHPHRRRPGPLAAVVDARRGEVYWALFEGDGHRQKELRAPSVASPQDAAHEIGNVLAVGDGAFRYREIFEAAGGEVAGPGDMWPSPLAVAEVGMERIAGTPSTAGEAFDAGALPGPLYLRQADVRIGWDQVDGRVGSPATSATAEPKLDR